MGCRRVNGDTSWEEGESGRLKEDGKFGPRHRES